ncbi:hypothetical protein SAY87_019559 [Trapa incisa]|uniref:Uncharacterized protein n=1 Tax=Trapa incisa TaxID=236973 RepID=A0AAN7K5Y4_9MYRT|nr:hypothetical protein SAY87_019559 [Trapa incisa]
MMVETLPPSIRMDIMEGVNIKADPLRKKVVLKPPIRSWVSTVRISGGLFGEAAQKLRGYRRRRQADLLLPISSRAIGTKGWQKSGGG